MLFTEFSLIKLIPVKQALLIRSLMFLISWSFFISGIMECAMSKASLKMLTASFILVIDSSNLSC